MICLLPNCCFLSETSRMLAIQRALAARGVDVRVATHGGTHERVLADAGVPYDLLGPRMSPERCERFVRSIPGIAPPDQSMWSDDELRAYVAAEAAYFREHGIRVAVTGWTLTALLSSRVAGDVTVVTEHAGSFIPPVYERGLLPLPDRPLGLPLERRLPRGLRRKLYNAGIARRDLYTSGFNRVAAELGVEGIPSFPALLLGDLTLVTDVPEVLGIPRAEIDAWTPRRPASYRAGARMRCAGPMYATLDVPLPERVERWLAGPGRKVYVAITSSTAALVREVVAALHPLDARILVAATVHDLRDLEDEQVLVEGVLPSHAIMPRVDLAVTAGGQGSVQTALASGVPLLGIPLQPEQAANLELARRAGAALSIAQAAAGSPALAAAARRLLDDPRHRDSARRLQAAFAAVDGPGAAADAILDLLAEVAPAANVPALSR